MKKQCGIFLLAAALTLSPFASSALAAGKSGDVDLDSEITCKDVVLLTDYVLSNASLTDVQFCNSDLTSDGKLNAFDLAALKRYSSALPPQGDVLEPKGTVHSGYATYYDGGYEGGCAMLDPISKEDYWITAMNVFDYDNALLAGAYLEVTGELGTINVLVTDLLPEGQKGDLDLYIDAFPLIAPAIKGKVPVTWKIVPLDSAEDAPISFKFKEGSSPFWCAVQVRNHRYPIAKMEYLNASGEYVELTRRHYNYFESDAMGAGPYTFRITDIYGSVIIDENIPLVPDGITEGHVQLPL
ncbi:MAG: hypothetical protein IKL00_00025 [Oscillospiraceae bacterium]|nr:hypothetical protein [Oscillospiraceae bacterium]